MKTKIMILGQEILVKRVKPKPDTWGEFNTLKHEITLNSNLKGKELTRVYIHETFHAALKVSGLDQILSLEQQEALCVMFESLYDDILKLEEK